MKSCKRYKENVDRSHALVTLLDTVRSKLPDTVILESLEKCLSEYQEALIALLLFEVQNEVEDSNHTQLTHSQQIIADAQSFEQYQQTLVKYLEARQRLKVTISQLYILLHNQQTYSVENEL